MMETQTHHQVDFNFIQPGCNADHTVQQIKGIKCHLDTTLKGA